MRLSLTEKAIVGVAFGLTVFAAYDAAIRKARAQGRTEGIVVSWQPVIERVDTVFARDTVRLGEEKADLEEKAEEVMSDSTITVEEFAAYEEEVAEYVVQCEESVRSANLRVAARDSLIAALSRPKSEPIVRPWVEGLYDHTGRAPVARAGVDVRLPKGISAVGAVEYSREPRILVGLRKTF